MGWTEELVWLHNASDVLIWLAYMSIPMVLLFFALRRRRVPFHGIFLLFAAFILACGFTHLLDAISFYAPVYRALALMKLLTAAISCATVVALVPTLPRALNWLDQLRDTSALREARAAQESEANARLRQYMVALLACTLALLVRQALDGYLGSDHAFVLSLLAVVAVAWQGGFGPALLTLVLSLAGFIYFFMEPRYSLHLPGPADQIAIGMFFFCGLTAALLGEAQRNARRQAEANLHDTIRKQSALEAEITRRRDVEAALRLREAELVKVNKELTAAQVRSAETFTVLDSFLQNAPIGMAFCNTELRYVHVNKYLADAHHLPVENHLGKSTGDVPPDFSQHLAGEVQSVLATRQPVVRRVVRPGIASEADRDSDPLCEEGQVWYYNLFPVRREGGEPIGVGVIAQDVTERVRAEQQLRRSEDRFRNLAETVPLMVWMTRPNGYHEYYNQNWYDYTGLTEEESIGFGWSKPLHPDDVQRSTARWELSTSTGDFYEIEYRFRRHDGLFRWFLGRARPLRDASGRIDRWVGTCTDIHDQKTSNDALKHSEERYRGLTQAVPQMVWTTDTTGEVTFFNRRWVDYTGITVEMARKENWTSAVHPDDVPPAIAAWHAALQGQTPTFRHEYRLRRVSDGSYRWMLSTGIPLRDSNGAITEWVGTVTDIDDQKRSAERLEQMVRERTLALSQAIEALKSEVEERGRAENRERQVGLELLRSNQELEQFAYIASHDLQEPLRKIQAFGDRLQARYKEHLAEQGRDYIDRMLYSAARMRRLIDDLLIFSRVTTRPHALVPIDLDEVLEGVLSDLEVRIQQTGAVVEAQSLPAIEADPMQMRQLFQNLVGNALKFARADRPPHVCVFSEMAEPPAEENPAAARSWVNILIADNGIGFEEKYLDRIFQVFQRLHGRDEYEGTGVGLAICRKIVERHGGRITARSQPGQGATFIVTLPVVQQTQTKE